jgi:Histidine kinase-, DNA gyrase B-, and HSP90-like ATPase
MTMGELAASIAHEVNQPIAAAITKANACMRWLAGDFPNLGGACGCDENREGLNACCGNHQPDPPALQEGYSATRVGGCPSTPFIASMQVTMRFIMTCCNRTRSPRDDRSAAHRGNANLVTVSDTVAGLPVQQADQIFTAFFTTKLQGTGMELPISRSIVESHGGRLWAAGNSPRGASFFCPLPTKVEAHE